MTVSRRQPRSPQTATTEKTTANSKFALCGQNRKFGVQVFYEHLSWQTNPSPKTRTAQTCGTLAPIPKNDMTALGQFANRFNKSADIKLPRQSDIDSLEKEFSISLPTDYKTFLLNFGDIWTPHILDVIVDKDLDINDVQQFWDIDRIIEDKKSEWTAKLSTDIIPFASDSMGNIFGFLTADLKKVRETADIYFFDHDFDTVDKIADSFTDWINAFNKI